jgi:lysophospholipase L1-like esterase
MTVKLILFALLFCNTFWLSSQSSLISNLREGKDQTVVVYGTSLSSGELGRAWMQEVADHLNAKYGNHVKYYISGKGGMWSTWGVQNLEDSVISKGPDAVIIEFGINDAHVKFNMTPQLAKLNLEYMVARLKLQDSTCTIIIQVMNMPVGKSAGYRPNLSAYYEVYRQVAKEKELLLIDHYDNWQKILDKGESEFLKYVPDGIHPSIESAKEIIAPYIIKCLEEDAP